MRPFGITVFNDGQGGPTCATRRGSEARAGGFDDSSCVGLALLATSYGNAGVTTVSGVRCGFGSSVLVEVVKPS